MLWSKRYERVMIQRVRTCRDWKGANVSWPKCAYKSWPKGYERVVTEKANGLWPTWCESVMNVTKMVQIGHDQKDANSHDRKVVNGSWKKSANGTWTKGENGRDRKIVNGLWPEKCKWVTKRVWNDRNWKSVNESWLKKVRTSRNQMDTKFQVKKLKDATFHVKILRDLNFHINTLIFRYKTIANIYVKYK